MIKNVIFDMDGVLVDSEPMYMFRMRKFTEHYGLKLTKDESLDTVGRSLREDMRILSKKLSDKYDPVELERRFREFAKTIADEMPKYNEITMPYLHFVLPKFKAMNLRLAIASSSSAEQIARAMRECNIESFFDLYVSGNEFSKSKPDPEIYLTTLDRMGAKAEESIVIEDSAYGIEAAKRAGLKVIARQDVRFKFDQSEADYIVGSLYEAYFLISDLIVEKFNI